MAEDIRAPSSAELQELASALAGLPLFAGSGNAQEQQAQWSR